MQTSSRRRYLALLGSTAALSLAGCVTDDNEGPTFLVTDVAYSPQDSGDIDVQVTVENGALERQESTLEVVVRYEPNDGEAEEWRQTERLELSGGTEMQRQFRFEEVYDPEVGLEDYVIDAQLIDDDGTPRNE